MKRFLYGLLIFGLISSVGVAAGKISPITIKGATSVTATEAKALFDKEVLFVDVRSNKDWDAGRIPGAVHIELKKIFSEATLSKEAKKSEAVCIYCNGPKCMRSSKASTKAVAWGFKKIYYFRGGYPEWKSAGYAVE
ncbi:rhodanese-like domain-containing protein [Beggiatoa alba]|nr:rhodanese-like domain-containing protein [Beggiatoa alba]